MKFFKCSASNCFYMISSWLDLLLNLFNAPKIYLHFLVSLDHNGIGEKENKGVGAHQGLHRNPLGSYIYIYIYIYYNSIGSIMLIGQPYLCQIIKTTEKIELSQIRQHNNPNQTKEQRVEIDRK